MLLRRSTRPPAERPACRGETARRALRRQADSQIVVFLLRPPPQSPFLRLSPSGGSGCWVCPDVGGSGAGESRLVSRPSSRRRLAGRSGAGRESAISEGRSRSGAAASPRCFAWTCAFRIPLLVAHAKLVRPGFVLGERKGWRRGRVWAERRFES